ncbi:WD40-repeat-containing domain protein, partial [Mycena galopus ATCC 62051]
VKSVAFSPNGGCIASGSSDKTIRVWDAKTGKALMKPIHSHTPRVSSVTFSPDGAHIVSGSSDGTICLWDARTGVATANKSSPSVDLGAGPITLPHGKESWIRGPNRELIMWVPPEYRSYIQPPSPYFVFNASTRGVFLDMSRFVHGPDWVK